MGCTKNCVKIAKNECKLLDTLQRARCNFYSILFNLCDSPHFYHQCQNQRNQVRLFISTFLAEKSAFFSRCFIQNWEEIETLKMKKVLEYSWKSPGILFSYFRTNPVLIQEGLLSFTRERMLMKYWLTV